MSIGLSSLLLVALGGALGGMARLGVGDLVARCMGVAFPWGTLVVNLSGALAIGAVAGMLEATGWAWQLLAIGLLGGYTTVSSLSLQTLTLWQAGRPLAAAGNVLATLALGLAAVGAAWWLTAGPA